MIIETIVTTVDPKGSINFAPMGVEWGDETIVLKPFLETTTFRNLSATGVGATWIDPGNFAIRTYYARKLGSEDAISAPDKSGRFWIQAIKFF